MYFFERQNLLQICISLRGAHPSSSVNVLHRCRWDLRNLQTGRQHRPKKADGSLPSRRTFICEFLMHAFPYVHLQIKFIRGIVSTLVTNIEHRPKKADGSLPSRRTFIHACSSCASSDKLYQRNYIHTGCKYKAPAKESRRLAGEHLFASSSCMLFLMCIFRQTY